MATSVRWSRVVTPLAEAAVHTVPLYFKNCPAVGGVVVKSTSWISSSS